MALAIWVFFIIWHHSKSLALGEQTGCKSQKSELKKKKEPGTVVSVNETFSGQARTCQAGDEVLWLNLITDTLEGESMSSAENLHS